MKPHPLLMTSAMLALTLGACSRHDADTPPDAGTDGGGVAAHPAAAPAASARAPKHAQATASRSLSLNLAGTWQPLSHVYMDADELRIGAGRLQWKPCGPRAFHVAASSAQGATLRLDGMCSLGDASGGRFNVIRLQPKANGCDADLTLLGPDRDGQGTHLLARGLYTRKGCTPRKTAAPPATTDDDRAGASGDTRHLQAPDIGLSLDYPSDFSLRHDFQRTYTMGTQWKAFAGNASKGEPRLALVLDGSNKITAAEMRIGTSTDPAALKQCLTPPASATAGGQGYVNLNGTPVYSFRAGDAGMSHYLNARSYRVVQNGRCYAIDLIVSGTDPQVYSPPRQPPFSRQAAFAKLEQALHGLRLQPPSG